MSSGADQHGGKECLEAVVGRRGPELAALVHEWRQQRAQSNRIKEEELEDFYRKRSLLQRSVYPEDIAEAVYFFASDLSAKSTGNFLNVDAGNATSFTR